MAASAIAGREGYSPRERTSVQSFRVLGGVPEGE